MCLEVAWRTGNRDNVERLLSHHPQLSVWSVWSRPTPAESVFSVPISVHAPTFEPNWGNRLARSVLRGSRDPNCLLYHLSGEILQKLIREVALGLQPTTPSHSMRRLFASITEPEIEIELAEGWLQARPREFFVVDQLLVVEGLQQLYTLKCELPITELSLNDFLRSFANDYCSRKGPSSKLVMAILTTCEVVVCANRASFLACFEDYDMSAWDSDDEITRDYIACEFIFNPDWKSGTITEIRSSSQTGT